MYVTIFVNFFGRFARGCEASFFKQYIQVLAFVLISNKNFSFVEKQNKDNFLKEKDKWEDEKHC